MTKFAELGLSAELLKAIDEMGFEKPTEIQESAIPILKEKKSDFIGLAQTGTGKTAAFGLPLLDLIDPDQKHTQALILAPTRELGQQIAQQIQLYSKYQKKLNVLAVYGGAPIYTQIKALKRPQHVIIATPGRLVDLINRKAVQLKDVNYLILDEADEMLQMGFKDELDEILKQTPKEKTTWLFSATMPKEIKRIVHTYMNDPVEVRVDPATQVNTNIEHQYVVVRRDDKTEALVRFLDMYPDMRGVVFTKTRLDAQQLAEELMKRKYKADALHGDLSQAQRDRVMKRFKSHDLHVLIATDVAARGIDVQDLTHVFHFKLPDDMSYYTHRSGRTARAGKKGISIAFIGNRDMQDIKQLERQLKISFQKVEIPKATDIAESVVETWCAEVLNQKTKGNVDQQLAERAEILFGNLSKAELIHKMLAMQLNQIDTNEKKDLNDRKPAGNSFSRKSSGKPFSGRKRSGGERSGGERKRKHTTFTPRHKRKPKRGGGGEGSGRW